MSDFNSELATFVRRQNHEMSSWHIVGVGNISTLYKARADLNATNATPAEKIWLVNVNKRAENIRQSIEQYKKEIRDLATNYVNDENNDPNTDTSRSRVFIRKLDDILNRTRLLSAMGEQVKRLEAHK